MEESAVFTRELDALAWRVVCALTLVPGSMALNGDNHGLVSWSPSILIQ